MKKGKLLTLFGSACLVLVLVALLIPGCAKEAPAPAPAPALEIIIIIEANYIPSTIGQAESMKPWYAELEKRSEGRLKVKFNWAASLVKTTDIPDFIGKNAVQAGQLGCGYRPEIFNLIRAVDLPYLCAHPDSLATAIVEAYNKPNSALRKEFEDIGLKYLFFCGPERSPLPANKPAYKWEDLKGWKIRAYGPHAVVIESWGATPVGIPWVDIPEALERGTVDSASAFYFTSMYPMKLHDIVHYVMDPGCRFSASVIEAMSLEFYNSLPDDLKAVVDGMVEDGPGIVYTQWAKEVEKNAKGMATTDQEFITWTPEEVERGKALALPAAEAAYFEEMAEKGIETEARELYDFLRVRARELDAQSVVPYAFGLVEKFRAGK